MSDIKSPKLFGAGTAATNDLNVLRLAEQKGYLVLRKLLELPELHAVLCRWLPELDAGGLR